MSQVVSTTSGAGDHGAGEHCEETQYCKLLISEKCSLMFCIMIMWILNNSDTYCNLVDVDHRKYCFVFCILNKF